MARVLVLSPHPDDEAIGPGGTLRQHAEDGDEIRVIFLTSGENDARKQDPQLTASLREAEAKAAAKILGYDQIEFWRESDGALAVTNELILRLRKLLEDWEPNMIYAPHPAEMHVDHRAACELLKQSLQNSKAVDVWLYEVWTPLQEIDRVVDISDFIDLKIEAIRAHNSQCEMMRFDEAARALNRYRGELHSWPGSGPYAEIFQKFAESK